MLLSVRGARGHTGLIAVIDARGAFLILLLECAFACHVHLMALRIDGTLERTPVRRIIPNESLDATFLVLYANITIAT